MSYIRHFVKNWSGDKKKMIACGDYQFMGYTFGQVTILKNIRTTPKNKVKIKADKLKLFLCKWLALN